MMGTQSSMSLADLLYTQGFGTRRVCAGLVQQGLQRCALWLHLRLVPDRHIAGGKGSAEQVTLDAV